MKQKKKNAQKAIDIPKGKISSFVKCFYDWKIKQTGYNKYDRNKYPLKKESFFNGKVNIFVLAGQHDQLKQAELLIEFVYKNISTKNIKLYLEGFPSQKEDSDEDKKSLSSFLKSCKKLNFMDKKYFKWALNYLPIEVYTGWLMSNNSSKVDIFDIIPSYNDLNIIEKLSEEYGKDQVTSYINSFETVLGNNTYNSDDSMHFNNDISDSHLSLRNDSFNSQLDIETKNWQQGDAILFTCGLHHLQVIKDVMQSNDFQKA